jgi:ABC transporter DrrB family efflux protein
MSHRANFATTTRHVAGRSLVETFRNPVLLFPPIVMPFFLLLAFTGSLSSLGESQGFTSGEYTAFLFIFCLMQAAAFTGVMGGIAMIEDFESGFIARLMVTAPSRQAILAGHAVATIFRTILVMAVLTALGFAIGMDVSAGVVDYIGLYVLAGLLALASALWAGGMAMHMRSSSAGSLITLPIFVLLFLTPVFVSLSALTGWLHAVASVNPFSRFIEAGRGFLFGEPVDVGLAYGAVGAMVLILGLFAVWGVRRAEAAGAT